LICPRCGGEMRMIAFIEDYKIVKKILDYLGIYEFERKRPPPKIENSTDEFDDFFPGQRNQKDLGTTIFQEIT